MINDNLFNKIQGLKIDLSSISAYNYEQATIQELLSIIVQKMNDLLENVENFENNITEDNTEYKEQLTSKFESFKDDINEIVSYIRDEKLTEEVKKEINTLIENGVITTIIGEKLLHSITTDIQNLKNEISDLNSEISTMNSKHAEDINMLKELILSIDNSSGNIENMLHVLEALSTLTNKVTEVENNVNTMKNEVNTNKQGLADNIENLKLLREVLSNINEKENDLTSRLSAVEEHINDNTSSYVLYRTLDDSSNTDPIWTNEENLLIFNLSWTVEVTTIIPQKGVGSTLFLLKHPNSSTSVVLHHRANNPSTGQVDTQYCINTPDHGDLYLEDYTAYQFILTPYGWILTNEMKTMSLPENSTPVENPSDPNSFSKQGIYYMKGIEGFASMKYRDPVGVSTIGYGTTYGEAMNMQPLTEKQATDFLVRQTRDIYYTELKRKFDKDGVRIQNTRQWDALISFAYNLGTGAVFDSTFYKLMKQGDYGQSSAFWSSWEAHNKGNIGGVLKPLQGLIRRRAEERAIWTNSRPVTNYDRSLQPSIPLVNANGVVSGTLKDNGGWGADPIL